MLYYSASLVAQKVKKLPEMQIEPDSDPWLRKIPWRREWLSTPVFWLGEFHGQRSLVGYIQCGKEREHNFNPQR